MLGKAQQNICSLCSFPKKSCRKFTWVIRCSVSPSVSWPNTSLCKRFPCCSPSPGNSQALKVPVSRLNCSVCSELCWLPSKYRGTIMKPVSCQALGLTMIRANSTLRFLWNSAIESCKEQAQVLKKSCVFSVFMAFFCGWGGLVVMYCWFCNPGKQANMEMGLKVYHAWLLCLPPS